MSKKTLQIEIFELKQLENKQPNVSLMPCPCGGSVPRRRRSPMGGGPGRGGYASGLADNDCLDGCPESSIATPCNTQAAFGFAAGMLAGSIQGALAAAAGAFGACVAGEQDGDSGDSGGSNGPTPGTGIGGR